MIILIDGYNILKQRDSGAYIEEGRRNILIRMLGVYQKRRGHLIMLIFDGGTSAWPVKEIKAGIMVIYAGAGKTADDFIKNYIAEHYTEDLFLVSSDRELGVWASKYDTPSMDAIPFYDIVSNKYSSESRIKVAQGQAVKITAHEDPVLDALMLEASKRVVIKLEDGFQEKKRRSGQQESKIARLLRKKIEKL